MNEVISLIDFLSLVNTKRPRSGKGLRRGSPIQFLQDLIKQLALLILKIIFSEKF